MEGAAILSVTYLGYAIFNFNRANVMQLMQPVSHIYAAKTFVVQSCPQSPLVFKL